MGKKSQVLSTYFSLAENRREVDDPNQERGAVFANYKFGSGKYVQSLQNGKRDILISFKLTATLYKISHKCTSLNHLFDYFNIQFTEFKTNSKIILHFIN